MPTETDADRDVSVCGSRAADEYEKSKRRDRHHALHHV